MILESCPATRLQAENPFQVLVIQTLNLSNQPLHGLISAREPNSWNNSQVGRCTDKDPLPNTNNYQYKMYYQISYIT